MPKQIALLNFCSLAYKSGRGCNKMGVVNHCPYVSGKVGTYGSVCVCVGGGGGDGGLTTGLGI